VKANNGTMDGGDGSRPPKAPSLLQEEILSAYLQNPNAAAVGRRLRKHERHVRRVVEQYRDLLDQRRGERDQEQRIRADARQAVVQDWADAALPDILNKLDQHAASDDDAVAHRANKTRLELALQGPGASSAPTAIDRGLEGLERDLAHRLFAVETDTGEEEHDGG
jgi:hypothetical protein